MRCDAVLVLVFCVLIIYSATTITETTATTTRTAQELMLDSTYAECYNLSAVVHRTDVDVCVFVYVFMMFVLWVCTYCGLSHC